MTKKLNRQTRRRGRGEHSIFQRKDGRAKPWVLNVSSGVVNGKRRRTSFYFKTKREAQDKLKELSKQSVEPNRITVATYQQLWLDEKCHSVAPESHRSYSVIARTVDKYIGPAKLQDIEAAHVRQFYADLRKDGVSVSRQNKAGGQLRSLLRQAVKDRIVNYNAAEAVARPRVERQPFQPLTMEQVGDFLLEAQKDRLYALFETALHTGARSGELFALRWCDVDLSKGQITISKTLEELNGNLRVKPPKSETSRRTITIPLVLVEVLNDHRQEMIREGHEDAPVFCDARGGYLRRSNVHRRHYKPILRRAALPPLRLHDLRHQAASIWLSLGINIKIVSMRLGHESIKITLDTYAHLMPDDQQQVASKLDEVFGEQAVSRLSRAATAGAANLDKKRT